MSYPGSSLEKLLKQALQGEYNQIKALWSVSPYDWGNFRTNRKETVNIGKDCTLVCLAKLGNKDYRFIVIHSKLSNRPNYVVNTKGYPVKCVTTYANGQNQLFKVLRKKLFSK
jgi:hypothetical protein